MPDTPSYLSTALRHPKQPLVLLQQAIYCGVPAAHLAFHEVADLLAEIPAAPPVSRGT